MRRVELIANNSVEENLFDAFERRGIVRHYTKIPGVHGTGSSGPRRGDHIWPEENFILILYCGDEEAASVRAAVDEVKLAYPEEGIKLFVV